MSKKSKPILLIVESPAKCKKIEEYLGPNYKCVATYGHLRELNSLKQIDMMHDFAPTYTIIQNALKQKQIEVLKREIKHAKEVILASDGDREGEKIAYCITQLFQLDVCTTKRIVFHEITEHAIKQALANPRTIDMHIVLSQQTRQILDLLVGFKISPVLWKAIRAPSKKDNALSAGRCQTPALKLVYDNHQKQNEAVSKKVYNVVGYFTNLNIPFELQETMESSEDVLDFLSKSMGHEHLYTCSKPGKVVKEPPTPFTTSRIQQVASNLLHYSPKETMSICQKLYENGYITYMRTDSTAYSAEFIDQTTAFIQTHYGVQYLNSERTDAESVAGGSGKKKATVPAQEAHEAIRPTNLSLQQLPETIDSRERRMYGLIWSNALESVMPPATFYTITATIRAPVPASASASASASWSYKYSAECIDFPGWKIVQQKYDVDSKHFQYLQTIKQPMVLSYKKITAKESMRGSVLHYTEAMLVNLLEKHGIGRPSTFSSLVDKIQERGYVKKENVAGKEYVCTDFELEDKTIRTLESKREFGKENNKLVIQPLGIIVVEFLEAHFGELFDYEYTKHMEETLDHIAKGETNWVEVCAKCNGQIDSLMERIKDKSKYECKIDDTHSFIVGKYGPVVKEVEVVDGKEEIRFKSVQKDIDLAKLERGEYGLEDIVSTTTSSYVLGMYEHQELVLKTGKYGLYASWGEKTHPLKELGDKPMHQVTSAEVIALLEKGKDSKMVREITKDLSIRKGPKGDYVFYKKPTMKKPVFYDIRTFQKETNECYETCELAILQNWLCQKYALTC